MQSHWNEYASSYIGWYGNFSDPASVDDVFTGNIAGIVLAGLPGSGFTSASGRLIGDRFEENGLQGRNPALIAVPTLREIIGEGGGGLICNSCRDLHIEGNEFQFNSGWGIQLMGAWSEFNMTGGMMQDNGQAQTANFVGTISGTTLTVTAFNSNTLRQYQQIFGSGIPAGTYITALGTGVGDTGTYTINNSLTISSENMTASARADIMLQGASAPGGLYLSNVQFPSTFTTIPDYIIFGATSGANNPRVSIDSGLINCVAPNISYNKSMDNWNSSTPSYYRVTVPNCKQFIQGPSDFSINANSALGLQTTNATTGTILDMLGATTTTNSSMGLPHHTTGNRPTSGVTGMFALNDTVSSPEFYDAGGWNFLPSTTTGSAQPGYVLTATTTGTPLAQWAAPVNASNIVVKTTNYSLLVGDSGSTFTNTGAGGTVALQLPTAASTLNYCFYADTAQPIEFVADGSHTIRNGITVTSAGGNMTSNGSAGAEMCVFALNSTEWIVKNITLPWTAN